MNRGSCLCGRIVFTVEQFEPRVGHCHCRMCQKFHGAAFSTFGEVKLSNLVWMSGKGRLTHYRASNDTVRSFCRDCGSSLLFESRFNRAQGTLEISLAAFDSLNAPLPDAHIYTESQASWCQFKDALPRFLGYRE